MGHPVLPERSQSTMLGVWCVSSDRRFVSLSAITLKKWNFLKIQSFNKVFLCCPKKAKKHVWSMMWQGGAGTCLPALSRLAQAASSSLSSAPCCWLQQRVAWNLTDTPCAPDLVGLYLLEMSLKLPTLSTNLPMPVPGRPWKNTEETQDYGLIVINLCAVGGQAEETFSHHTTLEKISLAPITWEEVNPASWVV